MKLHELVDLLQGHLDVWMSPPVRTTAAEEGRPVPSITLDTIEQDDIVTNNSELAQTVENDSSSDQKWFHFHYEVRLRWICRGSDDREAAVLRDELRNVLHELEIEPQSLHDQVDDITLTDSGGALSYDFVEDTEGEMGQVVIVKSYEEFLKDDYDSLADIQQEITVTN
jgi:hypothetical protein